MLGREGHELGSWGCVGSHTGLSTPRPPPQCRHTCLWGEAAGPAGLETQPCSCPCLPHQPQAPPKHGKVLPEEVAAVSLHQLGCWGSQKARTGELQPHPCASLLGHLPPGQAYRDPLSAPWGKVSRTGGSPWPVRVHCQCRDWTHPTKIGPGRLATIPVSVLRCFSDAYPWPSA